MDWNRQMVYEIENTGKAPVFYYSENLRGV